MLGIDNRLTPSFEALRRVDAALASGSVDEVDPDDVARAGAGPVNLSWVYALAPDLAERCRTLVPAAEACAPTPVPAGS